MDIIDNLVRLKFNLVWNAEILDKSTLKKLTIQKYTIILFKRFKINAIAINNSKTN